MSSRASTGLWLVGSQPQLSQQLSKGLSSSVSAALSQPLPFPCIHSCCFLKSWSFLQSPKAGGMDSLQKEFLGLAASLQGQGWL